MSNTVSAYPCKPDIDCHPIISSHVTLFQTGEIDLPSQRTGARATFFRFAPQLCLRGCDAPAETISLSRSLAPTLKLVILSIFMIIFSPLPSNAAPSCGLERWLTSLDTVANAYVNALGTPNQISTERAFRAQMERYSRGQLVNQINAAGLGANKAALESFIVARRHLYDLSQDNWPQMATRFGADPRFTSQSQAMSTFLQKTECDPFAEDFLNDAVAKSSVLERIQNAASSLTTPSKTPAQTESAPSPLMFDPDDFDAFKAPRYQPKSDTIVIPLSPSQNAPVYLGLFTFFVSATIWVWMRVGLAQRRAIRYPCNLPIVVFDGGAPILGELRDLSQIGAKLETGLHVKAKSKLLITMNATKRQARVAWTNQHFIGIKFEKALSALEMTDILEVFSARVVASHEIAGGFDALVDDVYGASATKLSDHIARMNPMDREHLDLAELSDADKIEINNAFTPQADLSDPEIANSDDNTATVDANERPPTPSNPPQNGNADHTLHTQDSSDVTA